MLLAEKNNDRIPPYVTCLLIRSFCTLLSVVVVDAREYIDPSDWQQFLPSNRIQDDPPPALMLHATAFRRDSPNEVGGTTYDPQTDLWHGINEDSILTTFRPNWKPLTGNTVDGYYDVEGPSSSSVGGDGTVDIVETYEINSDFIVKGEGIVSAPDMCRLLGASSSGSNDAASASHSSSLFTNNNDPREQPRASLFTTNSKSSNSNTVDDQTDDPDRESRASRESSSPQASNREFWIVSESNSITAETNSYFSKRHGQPDLNTFKPNSLEHSRMVRVSSTGELLEEIQLPPWMYWDGVFHWDPMKCYGTRVYKGLHDLTVWEVGRADYLRPEGGVVDDDVGGDDGDGDDGDDGDDDDGDDSSVSNIGERRRLDDLDDAAVVHDNTTQLITINQCALYQDGGEPNLFDGSHLRIMFWDVHPKNNANDADDANNDCQPSIEYSRSYRYQTARLQISTLQKGAVHTHAVFGVLAISPLELLVAEVEFLEGFGIEQYVSDVFYVKYDSPADTVDHCPSLLDCDVPHPIKRHLLRRRHVMELSGLAWGPKVVSDADGVSRPTVALSFENDFKVGLLMELYAFDLSRVELVPEWENNVGIGVFVRQRTTVLALACVVFTLGIFLQRCWIRRQMAKKAAKAMAAALANGERIGAGENDDSVRLTRSGRYTAPEHRRGNSKYKNYVLASSVVNSCLLGGVVFGFPGMVLILRREGIFGEVCSCGVFCAGQQEQLSIISTMGFAAAIGSRLFSGIFLDKFGPKITAVLSGLLSTIGLLLLATAKDVAALTDRITEAWIILAVGGSSMHLTSFHVTNLRSNPASKRKASLYVSAGFGAGSLVLPVLQIVNQYGNVKLQTICVFYSIVALLLTVNSFFIQPWRAWNTIASKTKLDTNCFDRSWWPSNIHELTAIKRKNSKKFPQLDEALRSFPFWGECFWFSSQLFLLTYYLSTINQILFALGDASVNANVDSLLNNLFTRACVFFNGLGWLWSPIVGYLLVTKSIYARIYLEIGMAFTMSLMLTVPFIEVQVVVFLLQALVRLQVFSNHFAYIAERFGFRHFGLLNGISSLVAGAFGLFGYLLQIYSLYVADGNYGISYFFIAGLVLSSAIFPFVLKKKDNAVKEEEPNEVVSGDTGVIVGDERKTDEDFNLVKMSDSEDTGVDSSYQSFLDFLYPSIEQTRYESFVKFLYGPPTQGTSSQQDAAGQLVVFPQEGRQERQEERGRNLEVHSNIQNQVVVQECPYPYERGAF